MINTSELGVRVVYRNRQMEPTYSRVYSLKEYTEQLQSDLQRVISDVESLCYEANGNKEKEEWTDETFVGFNKIKHKLLDKAGEIGRITDNLVVREPLSNFVARILEGGVDGGESCMGSDGRHSVRQETDPLQAGGKQGKL
jgi:hypothetical protein